MIDFPQIKHAFTNRFSLNLSFNGLCGFALSVNGSWIALPGGDTESSQAVADLLSPSENRSETPGSTQPVLSPRSPSNLTAQYSLGRRPRLLQPSLLNVSGCHNGLEMTGRTMGES